MKLLLSLVPAALIAAVAVILQASVGPTNPSQEAHAAGSLPAGWPSTLQLGTFDAPGGAAAMKAVAPFQFRYQYLAGGVNTGNGWANWNANGQFATYYIQDSVNNGITPIFTYYMLCQSSPASGCPSSDESGANYTNLQNTATMVAYYNDFKLLLQKAAAFPTKTVLIQVEPDFWGFMQRRSTGDNAATVSAKVSATGLADLANFSNDLRGFAQALVHLRDLHAPNVLLGYELSIWGTGNDILYSNPSNPVVDQLATRAGNFYNSLQADFDIVFSNPSDRDARFKQYQYGDGGAAWWDAGDYTRHVRFIGTFVGVAQKRVILWQIPFGNTKMRAVNNTWNHYQDNHVEWLLDDSSRVHLSDYINAGVVALLFGRGADGATCACDANNDGVTNPAPINGNNLTSLNADDDGGFFKQKAAAYYATGAMSLSGGAQSPTATPSTIPATSAATPTTIPPTTTATPTTIPPTSTATPAGTTPPGPTATPPPANAWATSSSSSPATVRRGSTETLTVSVTSGSTRNALVDIEIYAPNGAKVYQTYFDAQSFAAGVTKKYTASWRLPSNAATGTYTVKVGVFSVGWGTLYAWNNSAGTFRVIR